MITKSSALRNLTQSLLVSNSTSGRGSSAARTAGAVLCALLLLAAVSLPARAQSVSFAGAQTTLPFSGLNGAYGVAVDKAGDVFVADLNNNRVVELPAGCTGGACQVTVGFGLSSPAGVAVDGGGNVFIGDFHNNRVVEVPAGCTSGACQVTVGSGLNGPEGVALDGAGDVFIADYGNNRVVEVPVACLPSSCQNTVGTGFTSPEGVGVDALGDVFVDDTGHNQVVEVPAGCTTGGCQIIIATGLANPSSVAVDAAGDVFIADFSNNRVLEVPAGCTSSSCQTTVGSGLSGPAGVAVDGLGDVFVGDFNDSRVVEVQRGSVNFGGVNIGSGSTLTLNYHINASVTLASNVKVVTQGATNLDYTVSGTPTCTGSQTAGNSCTVTVSFAPGAPGPRIGAVQIMDSTGNLLVTTLLSGQGLGPAVAFVPGTQITVGSGLSHPDGVAVDAAGDVFIADLSNNRVVEIPAGCTGSSCQTTVGSGLSGPAGVAVDGAGDVFISDFNNNRVVEVPVGCASSSCQTTVGSGLNGPEGVAVDGAGNLFVADTYNVRVVEIPLGCTSSSCQITIGSGLINPEGVSVDGTGNVFISDGSGNRVVVVPVGCTSSSCQTTVGSGLSGAASAAIDAAGDIFIADFYNNRVVEVPPGCTSSNCQTTVGSGLSGPAGVARDGNVFISDYNNNRAVEVQRSLAPSLTFPATAVGSTSTPQTVTVQNIGNAVLAFASFAASTNFVVDAGTTTCSTSSALAAGGSCNVGVACAPTASGTLNGTLTLTDNALNGTNATQKISLSCTGTGGGTAPTITSANNTTFIVGTPGSFTVTTTGSPTPSITEAGALPGGVTFVDNHNGTGTLSGIPTASGVFSITFTAQNGVGSPATQAFTLTVSSGGSTVVNLASYYNVYGIATVGNPPKNGGFDNGGYAYNSSLLGTSLTYQNLAFPLGPANALDAVYAKTVALPAGPYGQLFLLGAAVNGKQTNQSVVVTYTDGTTSTFTQNFSDWCYPQSYTGETLVIPTSNRIAPNGQTQTITCNLYGYTFTLTAGKTAASVKLPNNRNLAFLAMGLGVASTPIVPYIQVNGGAWQQTATATVTLGSTVNLGPQPLNGGTWSWTGPNGYTSTSRQINNIPLTVGANVYVAAYTNANGGVSTQAFTITVTATWNQIGSNIDSIACASDGTLVVASYWNQSVWEYVSGSWTQLPGQMKHVAIVNKNSIWGIGLDGDVYYLNGSKWTKVGYDASYISAGSDGTVLVTNEWNGSIWKYVSPFNWTQVSSGYASVISVVKNNNYFVVNNGNVYQYNGSGWTQVGNGFAYVRAASDGTVLATTNSGKIYQYVSPYNWVQVPGSMLIAAPVKLNSYFGMGLDYNVYSYGTH